MSEKKPSKKPSLLPKNLGSGWFENCMNHLNDSIIITEAGALEKPSPKILWANDVFYRMTGYKPSEIIGKSPRILQGPLTDKSVLKTLRNSIEKWQVCRVEVVNYKKDGSTFWNDFEVTPVVNEYGYYTHWISVQRDVTLGKQSKEQLSYLSAHDPLTGLVNRREFESRAKDLLERSAHDNLEHALCYIDLDQFKVVNDTCGHAAGDEMLRQLGELLKEVVRESDTIARLGGDEFGVLMEGCSVDEAYLATSRILTAIQAYHFIFDGHSFRVGASIGLVHIVSSESTFMHLLKDADAACYMAKDLGRNRIHVFSADDEELTRRHGEMQWVRWIELALVENRFCLHAQKIASLRDTDEINYEVLIRMLGQNNEIIPPGAFLPAAERYDLMVRIDRWVVENTFRLLTINSDFLNKIKSVSINLSGSSLSDETMIEFIVERFNHYKLDGRKICFEITETAAITQLAKAHSFIGRLKEFGCEFALDDFGSGLSSFGYLKNLRVNYLKIDGLFVKDIVKDKIDHAMVKSINEIGHIMGMKTIAEFVESDKIKSLLKEMGVDYAQGYGIHTPQNLEEIIKDRD
jgi:diguanylate cyclase (GGDEF)-like protein/PAS domain S-box-containing protein